MRAPRKAKIKTPTLLAMSLMLPLFLIGGTIAVAQETQDTPRSQSNRMNVQSTVRPEEELDRNRLNARLRQRLAERGVRLTVAQEARLKNRCKPAQGKLNGLHGRIKGIETSRTTIYDNLLTRLTQLQTNLVEYELDTKALDDSLESLKSKIDEFKTNLSTYKQVVSDLAEMDCEADPAAFQASLEEAREDQAALLVQGSDIRNYLNGTVKTALQDIRSQLEGEE